MESIGDSLKDIIPTAESINAAIRKLEDEQAFRMFITKYPEIDAEALNDNRLRLMNMCREFKNCSACLSLDSCKNDLPQHQYVLGVHQERERWIITESLRPCRKHGGQHGNKK